MLCLDTDILIDYLRGVLAAQVYFSSQARTVFCISAVTVVELWAGTETAVHQRDWQQKEERLHEFLGSFTVLGVDVKTAQSAGVLRRDYRIPFADAIIAATALLYDFPLATRNVRHYRIVEATGLRLIQPY